MIVSELRIQIRLPWWAGWLALYAAIREWPRVGYEDHYAEIVRRHTRFRIGEGAWWPL